MKRGTIYLLCTMNDVKTKNVQEVNGYIIDLTNKFGYTLKIGLDYRKTSLGSFWQATVYETGVNCTYPIRYSPNGKGWKNKDDLIEKLKEIDFEYYFKRTKELNQHYKQIIDKYKKGKNQ